MKTDKTPGHIKLDEKMEVSDSGRLELKPPKGTRKPVPFAAQESPDDMSDSGGGEGGLLWDQHRGGCLVAWSREVLPKVDVRGIFVESGIL